MSSWRTLGLAIRDARSAWIATAVVLAIDLATMARDLTLYDSPELALVAHQLGIGHPIGQPLHTWLGFLVSRLGEPLTALSAMSAFFGALAVLPSWSLAERLAGEGASWAIAPVLVAASLHPLAWEPASRVEVYSLAAFLALWAVARAAGDATRPRPVGLALGLAACANAVVAAAHALALLPHLVASAPRGRRARELALFGVAGLAGLTPYVHVLLAGRDPRRFAWGAPHDVNSLAAYLTGADYVRNAGIDGATFVEHVVDLAGWSAREASLPLALLGLAAFILLARRIGALALVLPVAGALLVAFVARNVVFHVDVPDYRGYLLAPWMSAGAGVAALASSLAARRGRYRAYAIAIAALPCAAVALEPSHLAGPRDTPALGRALVEGALGEAPPNAIVLVEADHWVAPLLYAQEVEGTRGDVVVIAYGLASSRWYWEHVYALHPSLAPIELAGAGGRDGRIRRFLEANAERPVLAESVSLAARAAVVPCGVGWLVWTGDVCGNAPSAAPATRRLASIDRKRSEASESAARVGLDRGEALLRLGRARDAYEALVAGIGEVPSAELPEQVPPLVLAPPSWSRPAAIHDPARNVFVAALLCRALGREADAHALLALARTMGLPEAR